MNNDIFKSFIGWEGSNFDGSGSLVAVFERVTSRFESDNKTLSREVGYSIGSLEEVLANPNAEWSEHDRALLEHARANYPKNNGGMK